MALIENRAESRVEGGVESRVERRGERSGTRKVERLGEGPEERPAPAPSWVRVLGSGALKLDFGHGVVTNAEGLVLASARFEKAGGCEASGDVVQLDARGDERWRLRIVEAPRHRAPSVAMDDAGAAYLVGAFVAARVARAGAVLTGTDQIALIKLSADGRSVWSVPLASVPFVDGRPCPPAARVAADPRGGASVILALCNAIRVVRVSDGGNVLWDRTFPMKGVHDPGIGVDASGATAVWSCFQGVTSLDEHRLATVAPARFVGRIQVDGRVGWAQVLSMLNTADYALAMDRDGTVALAGVVRPKHGDDEHPGAHDLVLARLDKNGEPAARTRFAGKAHTSASVCVATTGHGGVALAGYVSGALNIAGGPVGSATDAREAVFLARLGGGRPWARAVQGPQLQAGLSVHGDASGGLTVAGWFAGSGMDFGRGTLEAGEQAAFFVARYPG